METQKSNENLITIIVILSLMVMAFGGYFIYDTMLSNDRDKVTENEKNKDNATNKEKETKMKKMEKH